MELFYAGDYPRCSHLQHLLHTHLCGEVPFLALSLDTTILSVASLLPHGSALKLGLGETMAPDPCLFKGVMLFLLDFENIIRNLIILLVVV